jgi:nucleoside-diphosphate-sugar epimerase
MNNTYSITKTTVERFVKMFVKDRGSRINNVRVVNAYGPRQVAAPPYGPSKVRKIIPAFACRAIAGDPVEVYGDGEQVSDMVYVEDVAAALVVALRAAEAGDVVGATIEVGPTESNTVNEVAECVIDAAGTDVDITHLPMRPGENAGDSVTADNETLRSLGIDPDWLTPMEEGIQKTVEWFEANEGATWSRP